MIKRKSGRRLPGNRLKKKKVKRWIIEQKDQAGFPCPPIGVAEGENRKQYKWGK